jgi:predicted DsbA family dithiol-disulfide isomerase
MPISMTIFSDFVCPFCYVGSGIIDNLAQEFDLEVTWVGHELHPETPAEGVVLAEKYDPFDVDQVMFECRRRGEPYGLTFGQPTILSNTRLALEAAEFARDAGKFHDFHQAMFKAYFSDGRDVGDRAVIREVAQACALDTAALDLALDQRTYGERIEAAGKAAAERGVTAIPCFFIEDQPPLIGAVDEDRFRERLQAAAAGEAV